MKKAYIVAIVVIVLGIVITAVSMSFEFNDSEEIEDKNELLKCLTVTEVKQFIDNHKVANYVLNDDDCFINDISVLGSECVSNFIFDGEAVSQIKVEYTLFQDAFEGLSDEEMENYDFSQYKFSEEHKKLISDAFHNIKTEFESFVGCTISQYDVIPTQVGVSYEDSDDRFYQGHLVREYSVRDRNGVLWLLRYKAAYGTAHATLIKVVDDSGYDGFMPIVDLTKS